MTALNALLTIESRINGWKIDNGDGPRVPRRREVDKAVRVLRCLPAAPQHGPYRQLVHWGYGPGYDAVLDEGRLDR